MNACPRGSLESPPGQVLPHRDCPHHVRRSHLSLCICLIPTSGPFSRTRFHSVRARGARFRQNCSSPFPKLTFIQAQEEENPSGPPRLPLGGTRPFFIPLQLYRQELSLPPGGPKRARHGYTAGRRAWSGDGRAVSVRAGRLSESK